MRHDLAACRRPPSWRSTRCDGKISSTECSPWKGPGCSLAFCFLNLNHWNSVGYVEITTGFNFICSCLVDYFELWVFVSLAPLSWPPSFGSSWSSLRMCSLCRAAVFPVTSSWCLLGWMALLAGIVWWSQFRTCFSGCTRTLINNETQDDKINETIWNSFDNCDNFMVRADGPSALNQNFVPRRTWPGLVGCFPGGPTIAWCLCHCLPKMCCILRRFFLTFLALGQHLR